MIQKMLNPRSASTDTTRHDESAGQTAHLHSASGAGNGGWHRAKETDPHEKGFDKDPRRQRYYPATTIL
jgi:hypothetical protein